MIFNKDNILKTLKEYNFDSQDYIVISGAALVLQDVKQYTSDIDIAVSNKLYNQLLKEYNCSFEKKVDSYNVWFIDNIINFSTNYYEKIEYIELFGFKVQTIDSVLKLKKEQNRSKDKKDIQYIMDFYNTKNNVK